jgi:hypothetical protein
VIYVLPAFPKKSAHGLTPPRHEMDLDRSRLQQAERIDAERKGTRSG